MEKKLNIRELTELREHELLSPYAKKSNKSLGRPEPEEPDSIRTCFAKDKDKIIHSHALRREKDKTQVFILPQNDHIMNRLTHISGSNCAWSRYSTYLFWTRWRKSS